ncbi:TetR/AcrR family transcriptional regulator [Burkholderia sp. USMB20]|uniref:TetR/AcrR family transcriptional regulator n=1 Tax=Burkholderia sp. USMB20 TaxID=1571773 RepID=UPI000696AF9A|nr:TetR/AcrR family transcriptional regulator [Burkholderia sp. USMB20]TGN95742.1 TetR/AcrR family transcriptional regulator [Burkholderia sp. USMB20]
MTRTESRERTRQHLLDAAALCIAEQGLMATSVEDIVARVGYTRGAFYSNFSSKRELFVELLHVKHREIQENLQTLLQDAAVPSGSIRQQFALLHACLYPNNVDYIVWAEARLQAIRDAQLRRRVNTMCVERHDIIVRFVDRLYDSCNTRVAISAADRALIVAAVMDVLPYFSLPTVDEMQNPFVEAILGAVFGSAIADGLD